MHRFARSSVLAVAAVAALPFATPASLSTATAQSATSEEEKGPEVTSFFLDNGLQVVVIPDHRAPVVTHMVWYKAGSADEPPGSSGIAHSLEHLMFKGTKTTKAGEFSAKVAAIGGQENAFTSKDYTGYFQRVTPEALEEMMRLEADRMENLVLTDDVIDPERSVVIEERNSRIDNEPSGLFREAMNAALYRNHRYGIPIIGWRHEIDKLDKDDAIAFYDKFYTPNNATLVVAGDVEPDAVKQMAERTYGKVARRAEPGKRVRPSEPPLRAPKRLHMSDEKVRNASLQRYYLVPSYINSKDGEELDLLSEILGGSSLSRIYRALVIDNKIASSAGAWYSGSSMDDTIFGFYATPLPGKTLEETEAAIDREIEKVIREGVTDEEVARAKNRVLKTQVFARDSQATLGRIYGGGITIGATIEDIQAWPDHIREVTARDVNEAARKYLDLRRSVTGTLTPTEKAG